MICGKRITPEFWVCAECEEEHGLDKPYPQWPMWAKQLQSDHENQRNAERRKLGIRRASRRDQEDEYDYEGELKLHEQMREDEQRKRWIVERRKYGLEIPDWETLNDRG